MVPRQGDLKINSNVTNTSFQIVRENRNTCARFSREDSSPSGRFEMEFPSTLNCSRAVQLARARGMEAVDRRLYLQRKTFEGSCFRVFVVYIKIYFSKQQGHYASELTNQRKFNDVFHICRKTEQSVFSQLMI